MKFTLDFRSDGFGKKQIDEPFGSSDINFSLKQKEGKLGRDVSFSGNEIQFEFTDQRNHELKQILYYHRKFGFESIVVLTIEIDAANKYTCDLDFATAETDDLTYFRCKGIEDGKLQIINARKAVKVDVLSDLDIDGNYIGGLVPENMLLLAKPVIQESKWKQTEPFGKSWAGYGQDAIWISPSTQIEKSDIESTLCPFIPFVELPSFYTSSKQVESLDFLTLIEAQNNLTDAKVLIKGLTLNVTGTGFSTRNSLYLAYSKTWIAGQITVVKLEDITGSLHVINKDYFVTIPKLERGTKFTIYISVFQPYSLPAGTPVSNTIIDITLSEGISISTESIAYNSISKSLRLVDVMRQIIKSTSGLSINSPRFEQLGQFYDNRLVNGNFLRGITDKPFYVSLEDIEKSIVEMNADYEIGSDGKVFFGIEQDFYTNTESGFFNNTQFSSMNKTFNPRFMVNEFGFRYTNYQSQKENEEVNSADTIHGECKMVFFNKSVENKKPVEVDWTRDAFLIEATRRKAIVIEKNTASQDDDTIFCIDSIDTTFDNQFTEVTELQHTYNTTTFRLTLRNDGSINFLSLGIQIGSVFYIETIDINAGAYYVMAVTQNTLELSRILGITTAAGNGTRLTKYKYTLSQAYVPFTNYTNQGFSETTGLNAADSYSNRRYSIARNIYNYWQSYIATCNLYWKDKPLKNTWYKNNGDYTAKYDGVKLTEKADFVPENPILSPMLFNDVVFKNVDFTDFITLQNNIRSQRGYIRAIDNNEQVIKLYPQSIEYSLLEKELKIKAEEKFEPSSMTIETQLAGFYLINGQTGVNEIIYEVKNEKVYLFDLNRYRLYNGIYWMEISVNSAFAPDLETLKGWLDLLK